MYRFLDKIEKIIEYERIDKSWYAYDLARLFAMLLTILAEAGQYRHEAFVPNPEKESDLNKRRTIDNEMIPMMAQVRHRTGRNMKHFYLFPYFSL